MQNGRGLRGYHNFSARVMVIRETLTLAEALRLLSVLPPPHQVPRCFGGGLMELCLSMNTARAAIIDLEALKNGGARKPSTFPAARRNLNVFLLKHVLKTSTSEIVRGRGTDAGFGVKFRSKTGSLR
jgi:hypothetical protein